MSDIVEQENEEELEEEELPILTAQRFLNIFRQIHIFAERKRRQFDEELLALPSDVIKALAGIPGASLLLNHIDELKGISGSVQVPKQEESAPKPTSKSSKKAKQTVEPEEEQQQVFTPMFNAAAAQGQLMSMQLGDNFSEELSSALANAFEKIENKHNSEIATLMNGMITTLNAIADKLGTVTVASGDGVVTPIVQNTNFDGSNIAELINGVMSAQTQMFSKAVSEQTNAIADKLAQINTAWETNAANTAPSTAENPTVKGEDLVELIRDIMGSQTKMFSQAVNEQTKAIAEVVSSSLKNQISYVPVPEKNVAAQNINIPTTMAVADNSRKEPIHRKIFDTFKEKLTLAKTAETDKEVSTSKKSTAHNKNDLKESPQIKNGTKEKTQKKKEKEVVKEEVTKTSAENTDKNWTWDKLEDIQASIEEDAKKRKENPVEEQPKEEKASTDDEVLGMVGELIDLNDNAEETEPEIEESADDGKESGDEDWEWEYDNSHPEETDAETEEGGTGEDWEWEYEEVPEGSSEKQQSEEDWEWEYEDDADKK